MSNTIVPVLAAGALMGAVAGGAASFLIPSAGGEGSARTAIDPSSQSRAELVATVDRLKTENEDLRARVDALETRNVMAEGMAATRMSVDSEGAPPSNEELLASLEQLAMALQNPSSAASVPTGFRAMVDQAIEDRTAEERAQRELEREQQRLARNTERVNQLAEELGLDAWQSEEMLTVYIERDAAFEALRDELRDSGMGGRNFRNAGESFTQLNDEYTQKIQGVLSPEQYEKYQEQNSGMFGGWSRNGGGGRGGRGG
jgi:hypothetical protein